MKKTFLIAISCLLLVASTIAQNDAATKLKKERLATDVKSLDISIDRMVSDSQGENKSTDEQAALYTRMKELDSHLSTVVSEGKVLNHTYTIVHNRLVKMQGVLDSLNKTSLTPTGKMRVASVELQVKQITALTDRSPH